MTGYTVHTGSSKKFASGWDHIFKGKAKAAKSAVESKQTSKPARTKRGRKST